MTDLRRLLLLSALPLAASTPASRADELRLALRSRVESAKGAGDWALVSRPAAWDAKKTAAIVCDMWNQHWCKGATTRVADMAPRMNRVLAELRGRGVLIIHCPSSTLDHYKDTPQRKLAQSAPKADAKVPLQGWCRLDPAHEGPLPIDDSDGGCDDEPQCKQGSPWTSQIDVLELKDGDAITDSAEAYNLIRQRGIENVIVMGVHANMCVLGRPFSIRQLTYQGLNVALLRDLTDTMYNSRMRPFVDHHSGTDLVVSHIEKYWAPTFTSDQVIGWKPFRFKDDRRKVLAVLIADQEYSTERTLPAFAEALLAKDMDVRYVLWNEKDKNLLDGLESLEDADLLLVSAWRRTPQKAQMDAVRAYVAAGKPVVGIRTATHAFQRRDGWELPAGHDEWPAFDVEVLGGHYTGHHGSTAGAESDAFVWIAPGAESHPILKGFPQGELKVPSWLYKSSPLGSKSSPLLLGRAGDAKPHEPVAWTSTTAAGGRVFYTSLGHPEEFKMEAFRRLLLNGVRWASEK